MYCVNKKNKTKIDWKSFDQECPDEKREVFRRDLIDRQIPKICDGYCRFPNLIKDEYALNKVCEACSLNNIIKFLEVNKDE